MKSAIVYKRINQIYLHASSKTTAGVWIASPPFIQLDANSSKFDLGTSVIEALGGSQDQVAHPTNWGGLIDPLLDKAGVRTWETFMRKAQCLGLESVNNKLRLIPNQNLGPKDGFEAIVDKAIEIKLPAIFDEIGVALLAAFAMCQ